MSLPTTILLVEDEERQQHVLARPLEASGFPVETATMAAFAAVRAARGHWQSGGEGAPAAGIRCCSVER